MNRNFLNLLLFFWLCLAGIAVGQNSVLIASGPSPDSGHGFLIPTSDSLMAALFANSDRRPSAFIAPVELPRMAPELALETYQRRSAQQAAALAEYSSTTLIRAELPSTSQRGEYELRRHYTAPHTLVFKALHRGWFCEEQRDHATSSVGSESCAKRRQFADRDHSGKLQVFLQRNQGSRWPSAARLPTKAAQETCWPVQRPHLP